MHRLWSRIIEPALRAAKPAVIVEVGIGGGEQSEKLARFAAVHGLVVHLIDPMPEIDAAELARRHGDHVVFHPERSLNALERIGAIDVALIDGDHNWYTVLSELELLERKSGDEGRTPPLVLLHDVGWPYGRRDLYYDPEAIPDVFRQPYARRGMHPAEGELLDQGGLNSHLNNAIYEHRVRNGVLTAVEDFVERSRQKWKLLVLPGIHGIAILAPAALTDSNRALRKQLKAYRSRRFLRGHLEGVERARLELAVEHERRRGEAARLGELRADRSRLWRRIGELSEELDGERADRQRLEADLRQREAELAETRAHLDAVAAELRAGPTGDAAEARRRKRAEGEQRLRESFAARYGAVADHRREVPEAGDLSHVLTIDGQRVLAPAGAPGPSDRSVDVVVCVHNALADLRRCLRSLLAAGGQPFHLILVDDGSDEETSRLLRWFASRHPSVELIENPQPPHGYTIAANIGVRASSGDYVVLLNSDAVVTPGWLEEIVASGESDDRIAVVGPLSNAATHQSIPAVKADGRWATNPLPAWLTPDAIALSISRASERRVPRVPFVNGFCFALRRTAIEAVGLFDEEQFGAGFGEENDFSLRAADAGFSLAVADAAYVQHAKSSSYGQERRDAIASEHRRRLLAKHGEDRVAGLLSELERADPLSDLRRRIAPIFEDEASCAREFRNLHPDPLEISFVLPSLARGAGGGVHSVYQEVKGLVELGVPARVMLDGSYLERAREAYDDADSVFHPYASFDELADATESSDVIVATHFTSAAQVAAIRERRGDFVPAYYVQDYEPFFGDGSTDAAGEAARTYGGVPGQLLFAKTDWLCEVIAALHGLPVAKVRPSIDRSLYHPGGRAPSSEGGPLRLAAMIRPRTPRRQPLATLRVLERLARTFGDRVDVITFGCPDEDFERVREGGGDSPVRHHGLLRREQVAELLRSVDVFVDGSIYQAFGRTGLEAMACGCAAVLPRIGGTSEYARAEENAILVDTSEPDRLHQALAGLVSDRDRVRKLQAAAEETARDYSVLGAAMSEYAVFAAAHSRIATAGAANGARRSG